jgi:hypothetical protein
LISEAEIPFFASVWKTREKHPRFLREMLFGLSFAALGLSLSARPLTMLTSPFCMPAPVCMVSIDSNIKQDAEAVFSVVDVDGDGTVTKEVRAQLSHPFTRMHACVELSGLAVLIALRSS